MQSFLEARYYAELVVKKPFEAENRFRYLISICSFRKFKNHEMLLTFKLLSTLTSCFSQIVSNDVMLVKIKLQKHYRMSGCLSIYRNDEYTPVGVKHLNHLRCGCFFLVSHY